MKYLCAVLAVGLLFALLFMKIFVNRFEKAKIQIGELTRQVEEQKFYMELQHNATLVENEILLKWNELLHPVAEKSANTAAEILRAKDESFDLDSALPFAISEPLRLRYNSASGKD